MSKITNRERTIVREIVRNLLLLAGDDATTVETVDEVEPEEIETVIVPIDLEPDAPKVPIVEIRANGRLTAKSAKALNKALIEAESEIRLNGNDEGSWAVYVLESLNLAHSVVELSPKAKPEITPAAETIEIEPEAQINALGEPIKPPTREERKAGNRALFDWMTSQQIVARGQAWMATKGGERSVRKLKALNKADGFEFTAKLAATVEPEAPAKKVKAVNAEALATLVAAGFTEQDARTALASL
jgi:hypothetical protein